MHASPALHLAEFAYTAHAAVTDVSERNAERDAQVDRIMSREERLRVRCDSRPHLADTTRPAVWERH